jgi:hypothetical protein
MDPPAEEKPLGNGLEPAKQEPEESTPHPTVHPTPHEHTIFEEEAASIHTTDVYNNWNLEEPISVSCAARCLHNSLQMPQVDSNDDDSAIGDLSRL